MITGSDKIEKVLSLIAQKGLDGIVVYSNGICNMLFPSYFLYLSELKPLGRHNALIISKSGDSVLIVEPEWDFLRASRLSCIKNVLGTSDFISDLVKSLKDLKMTGSIGLVGAHNMPEAVIRAIREQAKKAELADGIVEEVALVKTEKELENIRKLAKMADIGFKAFFEYARVGMREYELSAEIEYAMRSEGDDDNFILVSSSRHSYALHAPTDKRLMPGDIVIGEITPVVQGQYMQLCRTVVLGEPSKVLTEKYNLLIKALDESLKSIKTGVPASLISINMNKVLIDAGYAQYCYPPYMRARGHGLGVGSVSPGGTIDDKNNTLLHKNEVIIVHPNQYLPETGYLTCGESVLVKDTGFERLAETETKLYVKEV